MLGYDLLTTGVLFNRNVGVQDEGSYICMAVNEGGSTMEKVFLRLKGDIFLASQTGTKFELQGIFKKFPLE